MWSARLQCTSGSLQPSSPLWTGQATVHLDLRLTSCCCLAPAWPLTCKFGGFTVVCLCGGACIQSRHHHACVKYIASTDCPRLDHGFNTFLFCRRTCQCTSGTMQVQCYVVDVAPCNTQGGCCCCMPPPNCIAWLSQHCVRRYCCCVPLPLLALLCGRHCASHCCKKYTNFLFGCLPSSG